MARSTGFPYRSMRQFVRSERSNSDMPGLKGDSKAR